MDIKVTGAEDFAVLSRRLRQAGDKGLRKELFAGINRSVKPLTRDVKQSVADYMPDNYAEVMGPELKVKTRRRATGQNPAIFLIGRAGTREVGKLNRGQLRHPFFGNRRRWYDQRIRPGFWTQPLEQGAPKVRAELVEAIARIARQIEVGL